MNDTFVEVHYWDYNVEPFHPGPAVNIVTAHNQTPNIMWATGQLNYDPNRDVSVIDEDFGVDFNGPIGTRNDNIIEVPEIPSYLTSEQINEILLNVDVLGESESFGIDK